MPPPILSAIVLASWAWGMPIHGDCLYLTVLLEVWATIIWWQVRDGGES